MWRIECPADEKARPDRQLRSNWPDLYKPSDEALEPAEELLLLTSGGDYGWPQCYYDVVQKKLVLAPEYGGDGGKAVGMWANKLAAVATFPSDLRTPHSSCSSQSVLSGMAFRATPFSLRANVQIADAE